MSVSDLSEALAPPAQDLEDDRLRGLVRGALFGGEHPVHFGRFLLRRRIGAGAMGAVYEAYDEQLGRSVALKLLHHQADAEGTDPSEGSGRLLREARALARLSHPHVVTIHEVGSHRDQVFLAMELVRGPTLRTWVAQERPSPTEILRVLGQAGEGLAAAHRAAMVHRDFKPDNVMIDAQGQAVVLDFGLAIGPDGDEDVPTSPDGALLPRLSTRTGSMAGTPAYMPPERLAGGAATARGDQYAFAVSAWELLFGARPHDGASMAELIAGAVYGPPARPRRTPVPRRIVDALRRALEPDPDHRWPTMDALLAAFDAPRAARRRALGWVGAGLLALGVAGLALGRQASAPTPASASDPTEGLASVASTDPAWFTRAHQAIVARDHAQAAELLDATFGARRQDDFETLARVGYLAGLMRISDPPWTRVGLVSWWSRPGQISGPTVLMPRGVEAAKQTRDAALLARLEAMAGLIDAVSGEELEPGQVRGNIEERRDDLARAMIALTWAQREANRERWSAVLVELAAIDPDAQVALAAEPVLHEHARRLEILARIRQGEADAGTQQIRAWVDELVAAGASPGRVAYARIAWAEVAALTGDWDTAREQLELAGPTCEHGTARTGILVRLSRVALELGDLAAAQAYAEEEATGLDAESDWDLARIGAEPWIVVLGLPTHRAGAQTRLDAALARNDREAARAALAEVREHEEPSPPDLLAEAMLALADADPDTAERTLREVMSSRALSSHEFRRWLALSALVVAARGDRARGLRELRDAIGREQAAQHLDGSAHQARWMADMAARLEAGARNPVRDLMHGG